MTARWQKKAQSLADAWTGRYGSTLSVPGIALGLGPAQLETRCGDAWPGPDGLLDTADDSNNWGACTLRSLTGDEKAILGTTGIYPTVGSGHEDTAKRAMRALADHGLAVPSGVVAGIEIVGATIHCDSRTEKDAHGQAISVPYFVWFANFATPENGAAYYLHLLGSGARAELARPGNSTGLASAMYGRGYFFGFKPHSKYIGQDGKEHDGNEENVAAYAKLISYWLPQIMASLHDWTPEPATPPINPLPLEVDWDQFEKDRDAAVKDDGG